jgi:transcriptional regulator with XRE-family HTH domain
MLLGAQLRRLREAKGISREEAGHLIRGSESKISRIELGRVGFKARDVADLLTLYGVVEEAERAPLLTLAGEANKPGWWQPYGDLLPTWLQTYLDLEAAATLIRIYEVQFVPGLLQTEGYARAVILLSYETHDPQDIDRRVGLRMARQGLLTRPDAPQLWVVIDEAVLRRPIGGVGVMREQIGALMRATELPNVRLQVMPFRAGGHAAAGGAFTVLRFPDRDLPDVVYLEHLTGALYVDKREEVDRYLAVAGQLFIDAEPVADTPAILRRILHHLRT